MRNVTPPVVCHARTVPIVWPARLTSGIGAPPLGSSVTQPAARSASRKKTLRIGFDLHEELAFGHLCTSRRGKLSDGSIERRDQRVFHLHRFERQQALPFGNFFAL